MQYVSDEFLLTKFISLAKRSFPARFLSFRVPVTNFGFYGCFFINWDIDFLDFGIYYKLIDMALLSILFSKFKLFTPAAAKIIASNFWSSSFCILVSIFPLIFNTETFLLIFFSWSSLLLELDPIFAPLDSSLKFLILFR